MCFHTNFILLLLCLSEQLAYDPGIAIGHKMQEHLADDVDMWPLWEKLTVARLLIVRGQRSTLLPADVSAQMMQRFMAADASRVCRELVVSGAGHAPALMNELDMRIVEAFTLYK